MGKVRDALLWGREKERRFVRRFLGFARSSFCSVSVKMKML
jgi:hypothetical protein